MEQISQVKEAKELLRKYQVANIRRVHNTSAFIRYESLPTSMKIPTDKTVFAKRLPYCSFEVSSKLKLRWHNFSNATEYLEYILPTWNYFQTFSSGDISNVLSIDEMGLRKRTSIGWSEDLNDFIQRLMETGVTGTMIQNRLLKTRSFSNIESVVLFNSDLNDESFFVNFDDVRGEYVFVYSCSSTEFGSDYFVHLFAMALGVETFNKEYLRSLKETHLESLRENKIEKRKFDDTDLDSDTELQKRLQVEVHNLKASNFRLVQEVSSLEKKAEHSLNEILKNCAPQMIESVGLLVASLSILKESSTLRRFKLRPGFHGLFEKIIEMDRSKCLDSFSWLKLTSQYKDDHEHEWVFKEFIKVVTIISRLNVALTYDENDVDPFHKGKELHLFDKIFEKRND